MLGASPRFQALLLALAADLAAGEPTPWLHPVVWIGKVSEKITARTPTGAGPQLVHGGVHVAVIAGGAGLVGWAVERALGRLPPSLRMLGTALVLKTLLSARELAASAHRVQRDLEQHDLVAARRSAQSLVSRDTAALTTPLLASAAIESIAENAADSVIGPILYYAWGGLPAACAYRAANTLDAMIGYRGQFEHSGKVAARLDDALNLVPSRLSGGLIVIGASLTGGDVAGAWRILWRDGGRTVSPNAGWPMSAMAGALGVRLEKVGAYTLGAPLPYPDTAAIDHAIHVLGAAILLALPVGWSISRRASR